MPATTRDLTPLALHHNQHPSGLETGRMGPINQILLEISGHPTKKNFDFIFLPDPGRRQGTGSMPEQCL